jgi:hypothetical protein
VLHRAVRDLQLAGHDTAVVLDLITRGSMGRAHSIASVLHGRLQHLKLPERQLAATWAQRLPEARIGGLARQAALMMDTRTRAIGEQLAARPEPWLLDRLRPPPQRPGPLREDWIGRAGRAGFYRQAHGITDPNLAVGDLPAGNAELRMLWEQAHRDLEIPADEIGVWAKSQAELERTVRAYTRAAGTAPPDMSRQLGYHRQQAAGLERQAEQAEADGDIQLAYDSRAAAAEEARQAGKVSAAQDIREAWDGAYQAQRLAARMARQELGRRGIEPEPEHRELENLTHRWRHVEAVGRAIGRQRQAAIGAGQSWPRTPGTTARTPDLKVQEVIERLQRDGYLSVLDLQQKQLQTGMPEPAKSRPEPESERPPGGELDISKRIGASIRHVQEVGERAAADAEAQQQQRSGYAARITQEAQYEAQTAPAWPSSQAEDRSAEMDYEAEL